MRRVGGHPGAEPRADLDSDAGVDGHAVSTDHDAGANVLHRFDPETFTTLAHESQPAEVRQLLGRPSEVWGAESAADQLVVVRTVD